MIEKDAVCCGAFARISDILTDAQISVFEGKADIQIDSAVTGQSCLTIRAARVSYGRPGNSRTEL